MTVINVTPSQFYPNLISAGNEIFYPSEVTYRTALYWKTSSIVQKC